MALEVALHRSLSLALLLGSGSAVALDLDWLATLGLTSDYVHRGLTQSSGQPAVQAGASLRIPQGFYAGVWGSTIDTRALGPDFGDGDGYEIDLLLGLARPLSADWGYHLNLGRYTYADNQSILDYDHAELAAGLTWRERVRLNLAYSPDSTDHTRAGRALSGARYVAEIAVEWPLTRWLSATGGYGYQDAQAVSEVRFGYYSAGINLRWRRYALGLAQYGTDGAAQGRWADGRGDGRFVANLAATFGGGTTIGR